MMEDTAKEWRGPELPPSAIVLAAAGWLTTQRPPPEHVIPELQARFSLSVKEACQACTLADRLRSQQGSVEQ